MIEYSNKQLGLDTNDTPANFGNKIEGKKLRAKLGLKLTQRSVDNAECKYNPLFIVFFLIEKLAFILKFENNSKLTMNAGSESDKRYKCPVTDCYKTFSRVPGVRQHTLVAHRKNVACKANILTLIAPTTTELYRAANIQRKKNTKKRNKNKNIRGCSTTKGTCHNLQQDGV